VSCGNQHTAVLLESGEVYSFGRGNFGQLGLGSLQVSARALASCSRYLQP
jgi:alpha-tubulin suppressor-like RCC1 family protein